MKTETVQEILVDSKPAPAAMPRKTYRAPRLVAHGTLQQITGNVGNGFVDFPMGSRIAG
jgi:hypothetical protein